MGDATWDVSGAAGPDGTLGREVRLETAGPTRLDPHATVLQQGEQLREPFTLHTLPSMHWVGFCSISASKLSSSPEVRGQINLRVCCRLHRRGSSSSSSAAAVLCGGATFNTPALQLATKCDKKT